MPNLVWASLDGILSSLQQEFVDWLAIKLCDSFKLMVFIDVESLLFHQYKYTTNAADSFYNNMRVCKSDTYDPMHVYMYNVYYGQWTLTKWNEQFIYYYYFAIHYVFESSFNRRFAIYYCIFICYFFFALILLLKFCVATLCFHNHTSNILYPFNSSLNGQRFAGCFFFSFAIDTHL